VSTWVLGKVLIIYNLPQSPFDQDKGMLLLYYQKRGVGELARAIETSPDQSLTHTRSFRELPELVTEMGF